MTGKSLLPLCLALALAAPAAAADMRAGEEGAADWSGPWVGVLGSGGRIGGDGALGGIAGGYAAQFDQVVVGLEGDVSGGGLDARRMGGRYDIDAFGTIRARVGYAFDRFVVFGTAGAAFASAEYARAGASDRALQWGWAAGGGAEVRITGSLSARADYLYVDLDRKSFDAGGAAWFGPSGGLFRLGLNYRF